MIGKHLGVLELERVTLKVDYLETHRGERVFRIYGDGCMFPYLEKEQVDKLLLLLTEWYDMHDKSVKEAQKQ